MSPSDTLPTDSPPPPPNTPTTTPPPPVARCGPVELRLPDRDHAPQIFELARHPELSHLLQWPAHETVEDSRTFIDQSHDLWASGSAWIPGVFDAASGDYLGCAAIMKIERSNLRAETGTWLGIPYQNRGLNRYVKAAVLRVAFEAFELARLEALIRTTNLQSLTSTPRLPGARREAVLADRLADKDGSLHDALLVTFLAREYDPSAWPLVELDVPPA